MINTITVPNGTDTRLIIDAETGEILHKQQRRQVWLQKDESLVKFKRTQQKTNVQFFMLYRTNWHDIILKKRLSFSEIGVLTSLLAFIDWQSNFLVHPATKTLLNESTLAELLECEKKNLREHIARLNAKGLIAIVKSGAGYPNKYILNSNIAFFGRKMKDINEHKIFNDVAYVPKTPIKYEEVAIKD